jgi:murein DD-endopeptidase MepM/ murein hydrolase activator NlpD
MELKQRMTSRRGEVGTRRDRLRLTFAYRSFSRTLAVPRALAIVLLGVLPFVGTLYLAATCYFVFHDDLLASLTRHQVELQYAYEDRLAALRRELENATEQARAAQSDFSERVQALAQRQDEVESRTALVAALAARVRTTRLPEAKPSESAALPDPVTEPPLATPAPPSDGKPHPEGFDLRLRKDQGQDSSSNSAPSQSSDPMSPIDFDAALTVPAQIHLLLDRYDRVDNEDLEILDALQQTPKRVTAHIRAALASAGLTADDLSLPAEAAGADARQSGGMGGPFVPLPILSDGSSFAAAADGVEGAIDALEKLRRVLPHVPLKAPLPGDPEITSGFGPRIDPFLGTPALHTGVDLVEEYGAPVHATAAGVVVSAGVAGGYGNMVEIDHGNGLATRYAHLSSIEVVPGQTVGFGTVLGRIGATGRATGPHLHYEVRIDGEPVDPERFLRAGVAVAEAVAQP